MHNSRILVVIPARGGSKGLPGKNIKLLNGKALLNYTIDAAREIFIDEDICVSSDDAGIIQSTEEYGLKVPFLRPDILSTDVAGSTDVLLHALDYYERQGKVYDIVILLQPTSPFRNGQHIREALALYEQELDMVVSVTESHSASVICHENMNGYIELTLNKEAGRRQTMNYYEYNGAIYIINVLSLRRKKQLRFEKVRKYVMDKKSSLDIDDIWDFKFAEMLIQNM